MVRSGWGGKQGARELMTATPLMIVVLGAGKGTRMKSDLPKVLHAVGGRSMLAHVLDLAKAAQADRIVTILAPGMDTVRQAAHAIVPEAEVFIQENQLGTADAVKAASEAIAAHTGDVIVLYADTPLIEPATIARLREALDEGAGVAVLGFEAADPTGYGRLLTDSAGTLLAIREHKDASAAERAITLCNAGLMGLSGDVALEILDAITDDNAKREFYLTDAVAIARSKGLVTVARETSDHTEVLGVNTQTELAQAEAILQQRLRQAALDAGVTMVAPETVFLSADTKLARDVKIEPYVVFGPGVTVEEGVIIRSFCHFEQAVIRKGATVGPYARLRPGADIGPDAHIGNFVEVKAAAVETGAKVNHLTYIGNARIGERANIGAGTITCNYDGVGKYLTDIGKGAFIGSNSSLVAPVKIGDGAYVGSGSVITKEVPAEGLAVARGRQLVKEGWAKSWREKVKAAKK